MPSSKKRKKEKSEDEDKDSFDGQFWIPMNENEWYQLEKEGDLEDTTIH